MKTQWNLFMKIAVTSACFFGCKENPSNDENAVRTITQEYQEAYNHQDIQRMAALWASDAVYYNPQTGATAQGSDEITKLYEEQFGTNKGQRIEISANKIAFPSQEQAIQKGTMKVYIPEEPEAELAYQVTYVKKNGKWLINEIEEAELIKPPSNFEHLKDLAWLIGKWQDADDNIQVDLEVLWDKHKNFMTQNFKMQVFEQETLDGKQIIGWDPDQKTIKSWLFDSDGGFGHGTWEHSGDSWYADMSYTLNDGSKAFSKNVYTYIDANHYTFVSTEREVAGVILPDTEPVHVNKVN